MQVIRHLCGRELCQNQVVPPRTYCSPACRQAVYRERRDGIPPPPPRTAAPAVPVAPPQSSSRKRLLSMADYGETGVLEEAVREELSQLVGGDRVAGALAIVVARQLDHNVGLSGLGSAAGVLLTAVEKAKAGAQTSDLLDDLRGSVVRKFG